MDDVIKQLKDLGFSIIEEEYYGEIRLDKKSNIECNMLGIDYNDMSIFTFNASDDFYQCYLKGGDPFTIEELKQLLILIKE